jgi:hypothetical protein
MVWSRRADVGGVGTTRAMHGPRNSTSHTHELRRRCFIAALRGISGMHTPRKGELTGRRRRHCHLGARKHSSRRNLARTPASARRCSGWVWDPISYMYASNPACGASPCRPQTSAPAFEKTNLAADRSHLMDSKPAQSGLTFYAAELSLTRPKAVVAQVGNAPGIARGASGDGSLSARRRSISPAAHHCCWCRS